MGAKTIFSLLLLMVSWHISANEVETQSKNKRYIKTQFAGNIGVLSVGYGKTFLKNHLSVDLNYGYISKKVNGSSIHSFAVRPAWHFKRFYTPRVIFGFYSGVSVVYGVTKNTHLKYPDYFPTGYYEQNALHFNPYIGHSLSVPVKYKKIKAISFFTELGSTDLQIWHSLKNEIIKPTDIVNLSFGLGFIF